MTINYPVVCFVGCSDFQGGQFSIQILLYQYWTKCLVFRKRTRTDDFVLGVIGSESTINE